MSDKQTMVERVKQIIDDMADVIGDGGEHPALRNSEEIARAAIEAMREPTEAMLIAMWKAAREVENQDDTAAVFGAAYRAAIDAALVREKEDG